MADTGKTKTPYMDELPGGPDNRQAVRIRVRVQPRSSKNAVEGEYGDSLKVRLTSPPVEGEANKALVKYMADILGVKKADITIDAGHRSRSKSVVVVGIGRADAARRIAVASGGKE